MSIELHIVNPDVTDGNLQVTWCVSPDALNALSERKIKEPVILLITCPDGDRYDITKEHRQVVLLKDLIAYTQVNHSGPNKVYGVLTHCDGIRQAKKAYLDRGHYGQLSTWVLSVDGKGYNEDFARRRGADYCAEPLSVDVPSGAFAKEPSVWEKNWVNHFFKTNPIDQCQFRRRRMMAYILQPILIVLITILRFFPTLLSLLIGSRNFSFNYLIHPLRYQMDDAGDLFGNGTIFYPKSDDVKGNWRDLVRIPFMPMIFIPLVLLLFLITSNGLWPAMLLSLAAVAILAPLAIWGFNRFRRWFDIRLERFNAWYLDKNELRLITCSSDKKPLNWQNMPLKHKTLRLRFREIKSRVCRPFSR